jgi:hypothetical protein
LGLKKVLAAAAALTLSALPATAIVGGSEHDGPLARTTTMILTAQPGMCTAVVLAPDVLLTAAHCVTGAPDYRVHFRDADGRPVLLELGQKAVHPEYDAKAIAARRRSIDLALVRIAEPLPLSFEPAVLSGSVPARGSSILVAGWGRSVEGDRRSNGKFRSVSLGVVEPYGPSKILVWAKGDKAGACQGDSGGPVLQNDKVVAVTSWSSGAGRAGCGELTQGILLGPQRGWIDRTLEIWRRSARWE